jgi:preprotein translocase subunit SecY
MFLLAFLFSTAKSVTYLKGKEIAQTMKSLFTFIAGIKNCGNSTLHRHKLLMNTSSRFRDSRQSFS